jgi:hypothetical protein
MENTEAEEQVSLQSLFSQSHTRPPCRQLIAFSFSHFDQRPRLQMKALLQHYQEATSEELRDLERQKYNIASAYRKSRTYKRVRCSSLCSLTLSCLEMAPRQLTMMMTKYRLPHTLSVR